MSRRAPSPTRPSLLVAIPLLAVFGALTLALHGRTADAHPLGGDAVPSAPAAAPGLPPGSYVAVLANGQKLPWTTTVPAVKGLVHWTRLDVAVLRLRADGRYTLSYRYARDVIDARAPTRAPPARDEQSTGRYAERGRQLTFVPAPAGQGKKAVQRVTADVVGSDIALDKTVFVGERPFRVRLLFRRDPSIW